MKPMAGTIRRLETTLMLKTWKKLYFTLEDDKLCFYKHHHELEASDVIDLSKVTSVANRTYKYAKKRFTFVTPFVVFFQVEASSIIDILVFIVFKNANSIFLF